jgi:DNA polymerase V
MWGIADVQNFYCSSELVFDPSLRGKPLIVLSNGDGCAIARSEEAKALHINADRPVDPRPFLETLPHVLEENRTSHGER